MKKRVVITGLATINPIAHNITDFWQAIMRADNGIGLITRFDTSDYRCRIGAELKNFYPYDNKYDPYLTEKDARRNDPFTHYALATLCELIPTSGINLEKINLERMGVIYGSGIGGLTTIEEEHTVLMQKGARRISPLLIPKLIADMAAGMISIKTGAKGPNYGVTSACATSSHAIGDAFRIILYGDADIMICGGAEATILPLALGGFSSAQALSSRNNDPEHASRPFDLERDGFVMGEGAGSIILEELEHAKARGAKIYAELVGYGATADAFHQTAPAPDGNGAIRSMSLAVKDAGIQLEQIQYINAHGTSTTLNDQTETMAIKKVFGKHAYNLAISSTKSMIGHLLGASGAVELIATIGCINLGMAHPTRNYLVPDPELDLDYVPNKPKKMDIEYALSNSFGFGGHNATLVIKKYLS
jgi:3-oxoacyl-[acyl-carrier-protein] synthase II